MAKIPTQYDLGQANPRAEQVGSGFSGRDAAMMLAPARALEEMGQSISGFGLKLKKAEEEADAYTAKKQFYDFTLNRESDLYESEKAMEPGGKNFQADYASRYDEDAKGLIERTPQRMRPRVEAMVAQHRSRMLQGALRAETVEMDRYETEQLDVTLNNSLDRVTRDPTEAEARINDVESIIRDSHLSNRAKAKLLNGDARTPSIRQKMEETAARALGMKALSDGDTATIDRLERDLRRGIGDERDPLTAPMDEDTGGGPSAADRRAREKGVIRGPNGELQITPVEGPRPPPSWGSRRSAIEGVVVHHTAGGSLSGAIEHGRRTGTGAVYYIDRDGSIKQWTDENTAAIHMREPGHRYRTDYGRDSRRLTNSNTVPIEVVARNDADVTPAQRETLNALVDDIVQRHNLDINNVVGHGELQGGRGGNKEADEGTTFAKEYRSARSGGEQAKPNTRVASSRQTLTDESPPTPVGQRGITNYAGMIPVERGELPSANDEKPVTDEDGHPVLTEGPREASKTTASEDLLGNERVVFNGAIAQQPDMLADEILSKDAIDRIAQKHPGITGNSTLSEVADRIGDKAAEEAPMFGSLRLDQKRKLLRELLNNKTQAYSAKIASSKKEMENDIAHIARMGEPMPFDEEQARRWVTPNQWQKYKYDRRVAEMEWAAVGNIQNMNESEGLQHLEKLKTWVDSEKDDDLYKRKVMIFEKAQKKWADIEKQRSEDPALAVSGDEGVKAAVSAYRESGGQEGLGGVVEARLQAQRRLGIPEDPITTTEGRALVARFNLRSLTDKNFEVAIKNLATHIQNRYGYEHTPAVFASVLKQQFGSESKARAIADLFEVEGKLSFGRFNEESARKAQEKLRLLDEVDAEAGAFDPARAFQRPSGRAEWGRATYEGGNAFNDRRGVTTTGPEIGASAYGRAMQTSPANTDFLPNRASGWFDRGSSPSLNARRATDKDYWPKPKDEAIADLKKDLGLAAAFDKTFGPGAAARALRR